MVVNIIYVKQRLFRSVPLGYSTLSLTAARRWCGWLAARSILELAHRAIEIEVLEARLAALEAAA